MKYLNVMRSTGLLLGAALALAACSNFSSSPPMRGNALLEPINVPATASPAPAGANFTQALSAEYAQFATDLVNKNRNWANGDYFARKGAAAGRGDVVVPEQNSNWLIPLEVPLKTRDELADGRSRLVAALDGGGRDRYPALAARAQERYDCWVEGMEEDWKAAQSGQCHADFLAALAELESNLRGGAKPAAAPPAAPPPAAGRQYNVYFDFDKANVTPEAQAIVGQIATNAKSGDKRVVIVGKADLSGSDAYNLALSKRRADAVKAALAAAGIPADRVEEQYVGMREPPVPTAAGVREPRNRVVEVTFR
jgi:OmpA-OmpF porin, OOP family